MFLSIDFDQVYLKDRDELQRQTGTSGRTRLLRALILLLACFTLSNFLSDRFFIYWWLAYCVSSLLQYSAARTFHEKPSKNNYRLVLAARIGDAILSATVFVALWTYGNPLVATIAIMFQCASILHAMSSRIRVISLSVIDAAYCQFNFTFAWLFVLIPLDQPAMDATLAISLIGLQIYHWMVFAQVRKDIRSLFAAEQRMKEMDRLEAIGRLTGGISHDFNNILTVIIGNLDLYAEVSDPKEREKLVQESHAAAVRASGLTSQLLAFSRRVPLNIEPVPLEDVAKSTQSMVRRVIPANIRFSVHNGSTDHAVFTDPNHLSTAILNLVINARDATSEQGAICLRFSRMEKHDVNALGLDDKPYISIAVTDNGTGFDPNRIDQVFDPYFTTKGIGEGSGLGLSMVKGFAEQSKGTVIARNRPDGGAHVALILPEAI